jgi:hypothetical protein
MRLSRFLGKVDGVTMQAHDRRDDDRRRIDTIALAFEFSPSDGI